jgi:uncharacterized damage-inducible protein DinB
MTSSLLTDAFGHNVWATVRIIDACRELSPEQLETTVPGTYGSILDTLRHTVEADCNYLHVLSGGTRPQIDEQGELPYLREAMAENGPAWAALLDTGLDPDEIVVRHRDDGSESHAPAGVRLAQALHHGTDHRSQVCTALTSLGIEPPEIDLWAYAREDGRAFERDAPPA